MAKGSVHFIITGGTIDSFYDGTKDTVVPNRKSMIPDFVKSLKLYQKSVFTKICMKDSRAITRADLKKMFNTINKSPHKNFIVTHGTYTMSDSARYIESKLKNLELNLPITEIKKLPKRLFKEGEMDFLPKSYQNAAKSLANVSEEMWMEYKLYFYAMVSTVDVNIGRILDVLKLENMLDNTLIIFTSDHGDYLGDHGLVGKSNFCYDGVMLVPLIIQGPNIPKKGLSDSLVELTDIMPTILDYLKINIPIGVQGSSMMPLFSGESEIRDCAYSEFGPNEYWQRVIRTDEAKYKCNTRGEEILFDLQKDSDEFNNIANDSGSKPLLDEMRKKMLVKSQEILINKTEQIEKY